MIARRVEAAAIGKRGGCHLWRHTMATLMLEGGADIRFIQAMLGHEDISTTQIYTQVAIRQLSLVHARTHPGAARRRRSARLSENMPSSHSEPIDDPAALLAALDAEADEDDDRDDVAADA